MPMGSPGIEVGGGEAGGNAMLQIGVPGEEVTSAVSHLRGAQSTFVEGAQGKFNEERLAIGGEQECGIWNMECRM
jgi:hypothetical protein